MYFIKLEKVLETYKSALPQPEAHWSREVGELVECLNESIFDVDISIGEIYTSHSINQRNINGLFRRYLRSGVQEYVTQHRLNAARLLLKESKYKISDVAAFVGYRSPNGFSTQFKKYFGVHPSDFK